jgi:adenylate cyclase
MFGVRGPVEAPAEVMVVSIDRRSGARLREAAPGLGWTDCLPPPRGPGELAWPRCMQARLIDSLTRQGAAVIAFDVHFLGETDPDEDATLAAAVERSGRTVLLQFIGQEKIPGSEISTETLTDPFPPLPEVALAIGPFPLPKVPARVNQVWAFKTRLGDVPTLPVVALQAYLLRAARQSETIARMIEGKLAGGGGLSLGQVSNGRDLNRFMQILRGRLREGPAFSRDFTAPLGGRQNALDAWTRVFSGADTYFVNFYGPAGSIATLPADAVLEWQAGTDSPVARKIVFVGVSDHSNPEQIDSYNTVFTSDDGIYVSGVEIAAACFRRLPRFP